MTLPPTQLSEDVEVVAPENPLEAPTVYALECIEGPERSTTFTPSTEVAIGRDPTVCKLFFPDLQNVSRVHCKIFSIGRDVFVQDKSSNGTFIDGKILGKENMKIIRNGNIISIINPQQPESSKYSWKFIPPKDHESDFGSSVSTSSSPVEAIYTLGRVLGTGNFATVKLGTHRVHSKEQVAVKIIEKKRFAMSQDQMSFQSLQSEAEILRKMKHVNIIGVHDVFDDAKTFTMVLELVAGGDFFDYIVGRCPSPFTEGEAKTLFLQLLEALLYMHSKDVVHRDLKPENILVHVDPTFVIPHKTGDATRDAKNIPVDGVTLKVTDFGLAKFCKEQDKMTTMCGTPSYLAPEVQNNCETGGYSWSVDVWSLGVILFIMLSGGPPKDPQKGVVQFTKSMTNLSPESKNLIEGMLRVKVSERYDLRAICDHPWLADKKIVLADLATKKTELALCPTLMHLKPSPATTAALSKSNGAPSIIPAEILANKTMTSTDAESDVEGKSPKKRRVEAPEEKVVIWMWKKHLDMDDADPKGWQNYSDEDCAAIEKQRQRNSKSCKVGFTADYRISFEGMFQYSTKDPTRQRKVKFVQV